MPLKVWIPFFVKPRTLPAVVSTTAFVSRATIVGPDEANAEVLLCDEQPVSSSAPAAVPPTTMAARRKTARRGIPESLPFCICFLLKPSEVDLRPQLHIAGCAYSVQCAEAETPATAAQGR